ncbi:hypothetical protein AVEN_105679-1, partial [Araneus ventricosus]
DKELALISDPTLTPLCEKYGKSPAQVTSYHRRFHYKDPPLTLLAKGVQYHVSCNLWLIRNLQKDFRMKVGAHYGAYFDDKVFKASVNVYISIGDYLVRWKKPK